MAGGKLSPTDTFAEPRVKGPGGCFTNVSRCLQNNLAKIHNTRNHICGENFKLKLCTCAQSMALGTRTKFQLDILITSTIFEIHKFRKNILESSRNVSETPPRAVVTLLRTVSSDFHDNAYSERMCNYHWPSRRLSTMLTVQLFAVKNHGLTMSIH